MMSNKTTNDDKAKKTPRKISCLPCRTKKAKCDGGIPYCNRCVRNSRANKCIYMKPKTFGRPPKSAVFQKNQDSIATKNICREFIFENTIKKSQLSIQEQQEQQQQFILSTTKHAPHLMNFTAQILDIERIFSLYIARGAALREKLHNYELNPQLKLKTLQQHFTWLTSSIINITIKRACQLLELESFYDPEIIITAFMREEDINIFFFNLSSRDSSNLGKKFSSSSVNSTNNPLNSIPTDQAVQLIEYFFQLHPYSILLNKTRVLNDYWNDTIEPLLLCTIYGITIYTCQQTMKGKSSVLWAVNRNPFLNYAYILLQDFFYKRDQCPESSPSTLGNYQATVILGIFETLFGFSKHGMTIISLSYMLANDLELFQKEEERKNSNSKALDAIDKELMVSTYWAALRGTAYGCIELGLYLRDALLYHGLPFPPANQKTSASYQYDSLHNNNSESSSYLIESFHTEMVIAYFSSKLFACLPKTELNLFGCPTAPANPVTIEELLQQQYNVLLQLIDASAAAESDTDTMLDYQIQRILSDFNQFIQQEKYQWSLLQSYMIETTYYLYTIHFKFMKNQNESTVIRNQAHFAELDLTDRKVALRLNHLIPTTILLIQKLQSFLFENDDIDHQDENSIALLPLGLMMISLETAMQLIIYHYQLDRFNPEIQEYLRILYFISKDAVWSHCGSTAKSIQKKFKEFLKANHISIAYSAPLQKQQSTNNSLKPLVLPLINRQKEQQVAGGASSSAGSMVHDFSSHSSMSTASSASLDFLNSIDQNLEGIDDNFMQELDDIFKHAIEVTEGINLI